MCAETEPSWHRITEATVNRCPVLTQNRETLITRNLRRCGHHDSIRSPPLLTFRMRSCAPLELELSASRGFDYKAEFVTAARITSTTVPGALAKGVWSTFSDRIRAPMRSAIKS